MQLNRRQAVGHVVLFFCVIVSLVIAIVGYRTFPSGRSSVKVVANEASGVHLPEYLDAQRFKDINDLKRALTAFFGDHGAYPITPQSIDCQSPYGNVEGLKESLVPKYIDHIPKDPVPRRCEYDYLYVSDGTAYALAVNMASLDATVHPGQWCIGAASGPIPASFNVLNGITPCPW